jgi:two pore calcium channel protein 1
MIDVLLLLFIIVVIFSLIAYYGFADEDPMHFSSYLVSLVSLFITITTANHPDVFMQAYENNRIFPIFFVVYVFVTVIFLYNVLLAVLYSNFSTEEKNKFRRLFLHKREALKLAFYVLIDEERRGITYNDFHFFMLEYNSRIPEYQVMCMFKALQNDNSDFVTWGDNEGHNDFLTLENFLNFYETRLYKWERVNVDGRSIHWCTKYPYCNRNIFTCRMTTL